MTTSWDNFMGAPAPEPSIAVDPPKQATLPPPGVEPKADANAQPPAPKQGFHGFMLPRSVMDNAHWKGTEEDLRFGLREPDAEGVWRFIDSLTGKPGEVLPFLAAGGRHRGGAELLAWWNSRTHKVKNCIMQEFHMLVCPTPADVQDVRATMRRVGDLSTYTLPASVTESIHWTGGPDDLSFGLRDATTAEAKALASRPGSVDDCVEFIARDDARAWWDRLSPKAKILANRMFVDTLQPTEDEGKSIRASRTWVEG